MLDGAAQTKSTELALPFADSKIGADASAAGIAFTYAYDPTPAVDSAVIRKKYCTPFVRLNAVALKVTGSVTAKGVQSTELIE